MQSLHDTGYDVRGEEDQHDIRICGIAPKSPEKRGINNEREVQVQSRVMRESPVPTASLARSSLLVERRVCGAQVLSGSASDMR